MEHVLPDNDAKFLEIIVFEARRLDPRCIIDIRTRLMTHTVSIQTSREFKVRMVQVIQDIHYRFGLKFRATQFIKNKETIVSFDLASH